jgi:LmbE family N-acetylglucosaminyl deacetylase
MTTRTSVVIGNVAGDITKQAERIRELAEAARKLGINDLCTRLSGVAGHLAKDSSELMFIKEPVNEQTS